MPAATIGELRASATGTARSRRSSATTCSPPGSGDELFPSIVGFSDSVLPALERGVLAGHDLILLGERGQAKTRLIRTWWSFSTTKFRRSSAVRSPITRSARSVVAASSSSPSAATDVEIEWLGRDRRYAEKLATPDTRSPT
jgi:magnesium chelatase subunit I